MAIRGRGPIGIELVRRGIVTQADIDTALEYQKQNPDKKLIEVINILNLCDEYILLSALGEILGEESMMLTYSSVKINISQYISLDIAKRYKAIPFEVNGGKIKVCFSDTLNTEAVETVRLILLNKGLVMEKYITFERNIQVILDSLSGTDSDSIDAAGDTTTIVDSIIKTAMKKRASDIHIEPLENSLRVRYRIDGELINAVEIKKEKQQQIIGRLKAISNMYQEKQASQDRKNNFVSRL